MQEVPLLITGAAGRIGQLLRKVWQNTPPEGVKPYYCGRGDEFDLKWDILKDPAPALPKDAVVLHLAGVTKGDRTTLSLNEHLVCPLAEACRKNAVKHVFFVSTVAVYPFDQGVITECLPPAPSNAYGVSKWAAEQAWLQETVKDSFQTTVLRVANVVGADALLSPRGNNEPIILDPILGKEGGPLRSWIGPYGLAECVSKLALKANGVGSLPGVINISAAPALHMAALLTSAKRKWTYGSFKDGVIPEVIVENSLLKTMIFDFGDVSADSLVKELSKVFS